jgi:hypothetical protein
MADQEEQQRALARFSDEEYASAAAKVFEKAVAGKHAVLGYQVDIAKWLLASLLVINAGALVALLNAPEKMTPGVHTAAPWFIGGVVAAVASGLSCWANASIVSDIYDDVADPWMLVDRASWPKIDATKARNVTITTVMAIGLGIASTAAFVIGCLSVA